MEKKIKETSILLTAWQVEYLRKLVDCEDVASAIENASVSQCYFWLVNEVLRKLIITPSEQTLSRMESRLNFDLEHYAYIKDEDLRKKILDCVFGREGMGITELKQNKDKEGGAEV